MHRKDAAAASPPWENYRRALNPCRNLKLTPPGVEKRKSSFRMEWGRKRKKSLVRRRAFPNRSEIQSKLCFKSYQFWKEKASGRGGIEANVEPFSSLPPPSPDLLLPPPPLNLIREHGWKVGGGNWNGGNREEGKRKERKEERSPQNWRVRFRPSLPYSFLPHSP